MVASNLSSECCVLSIPDIFGSATLEEEFVVQEPDDEKYFTMVDDGTIHMSLNILYACGALSRWNHSRLTSKHRILFSSFVITTQITVATFLLV